MDKETMFIGDIIKRLRVLKQLSQEELAYRSDLDRTSISNIETNKQVPSLSTTFHLANGLGIKPSELVKVIEENTDYDV